MCGICGVAFADPRRAAEPETIARMMAAVAHRGPDGSGSALASGAALGFRRLSVIDLETGGQPIASEDGAVTLVCNGEIYNAPELRSELEAAGHRFRTRSDVEVIVHLYEDLGPECTTRLRGMFGFALWDARRRRLMLARDRLGIKPLVYAARPDALWFASEAKAILAAGVPDGGADPAAIEDIFALAFVAGPRTMFASIRKLPPAHVALYREGALSLHRYWSLPEDTEHHDRSAAEWAEAVREKLDESVRVHLRSDVSVAAWLSPGLDSSAVAALASRHLGESLHTFTVGFDDPEVDETRRFPTLDTYPGHEMPNERVVCGGDSLGLLPRSVWHHEQPTAFGTDVPRLLLAAATARRFKVVVTGEGADEVFGGYPHFAIERAAHRVAGLPPPVRRALAPLVAGRRPVVARMLLAPREMTRERYARLIGPVYADERHALLSAPLRERLAADPGRDDWPVSGPARRRGHWFDRLQRCEIALRMPDMVVHGLDRAAMAHGVEARVPFLDHELVELGARIPARLKARGGIEKALLRRALRGVLPEEVRLRRKRGLGPPFERWMREPLPEFAEDLLSPHRLEEKGYFEPHAVRRLLAEQQAGGRRLGAVLVAVLGVQLWDEIFLRRRGAAPGADPVRTPG